MDSITVSAARRARRRSRSVPAPATPDESKYRQHIERQEYRPVAPDYMRGTGWPIARIGGNASNGPQPNAGAADPALDDQLVPRTGNSAAVPGYGVVLSSWKKGRRISSRSAQPAIAAGQRRQSAPLVHGQGHPDLRRASPTPGSAGEECERGKALVQLYQREGKRLRRGRR